MYPVRAAAVEVTPFHFRECSLLGCRAAGDAGRQIRLARRLGPPQVTALGCNQLLSQQLVPSVHPFPQKWSLHTSIFLPNCLFYVSKQISAFPSMVSYKVYDMHSNPNLLYPT